MSRGEVYQSADASLKRRINDAKFVCPVHGCGATFSRHFNLKGHLRSHNDEKPFQCKWPGCGKGFARQHDCKRHEQLHSNLRLFICDGCKKQFTRLDALNRHCASFFRHAFFYRDPNRMFVIQCARRLALAV
ncbi:hypothetical protein EDB85DRAFT_1857844 [Lactarius pseudohatsudake]|nr:hypothetical protein EDB85DRAFT_1857844 [Lactarius pseudohatsudake]